MLANEKQGIANNLKNGFTLIELLAIIVILSIIALITTPIIFNMIDDTKKSAAIDSAYSYIDAIDYYQAERTINNKNLLPSGIYNIEKDTIVGEKIYQKLNDVVKLRGKKPTSGTISINSYGKVVGLKICVNNYLLQYIGNQITIISNNCNEIDLFANYSIDKQEMANSKKLTITYPNGSYKYFLKIIKGKVLLDDIELEVNKDIEVSKTTILKLESNSKIETWVEKNEKKIGISNYSENKINYEKLYKPEIIISNLMPYIKNEKIVLSNLLTINNNKENKNPNYKLYYELDDDGKWILYNGPINIVAKKVKAKVVTENVNQSEFNEAIIDNLENYQNSFSYLVFDDDDSTSFISKEKTDYIIQVEKVDYEQNLYIDMWTYSNSSGPCTIYVYDDNNNVLLQKNKADGKFNLTLPVNTSKVVIHSTSANDKFTTIRVVPGIRVKFENKINIYPYVYSNKVGFKNIENTKVSVDYNKNLFNSLEYKIDNGNWVKYNDKINLKFGSTVSFKGTDLKNRALDIISKTYGPASDTFGVEVFDGDLSTLFKTPKKGNYYIYVDNQNIEQTIFVKMNTVSNSSGPCTINMYDKDGNILSSKQKADSSFNLLLPSGTYKIEFQSGTAGDAFYEINLTN